MNTLREWKVALTAQGVQARDVEQRAPVLFAAHQEANNVLSRLSASSRKRIKRSFESMLRSPGLAEFQSERRDDFINASDRAGRCYDAAVNGDDGSTHAEVIEDWRDYLYTVLCGRDPERFSKAMEAEIELVELYHVFHGTINNQVGY